MATPAAFLGVPGLRRPHAPAPALGADTSRVLHELGFTAEEIAAVAGWDPARFARPYPRAPSTGTRPPSPAGTPARAG